MQNRTAETTRAQVNPRQTDPNAGGDYFGDTGLIDEGTRSATVTQSTEVVRHDLTFWEFRPLVQTDATIAWNPLQTPANRLWSAKDI